MNLPITLSAVAAAALINIWLSIRCGQVRTSEKVSVGDGGNEKVIRRMRAHSNFTENTPMVLVMIAALEFAHPGSTALAAVAGLFMFGRVAHGIGMDGGSLGIGRMIGTLITLLAQLGLAIWAIISALG
ncbi:glutathione S-transferase [Novosphingobium sediminis]|uniref:Glutathione S-transferase n=1 Tax=Novosphingobium sediminis TaxID=707214 RepID=A0A512AJM0_9SPHN|nr:MAPEG family protein [Novosphingobium sediminis]GEN99901.1 glutathione S-transferase [Novosphingobium sediminis]